MYRIKSLGAGQFEIRHPDGYWIGPGLGVFRSVAEAFRWLEKRTKR